LKSVLVKTDSKNYPVYIGENVFSLLPELLRKHNLPKRIIVIVDKKVDQVFGSLIRRKISRLAIQSFYLPLISSEKIKSLKTVIDIFKIMFDKKFGKDTLLIAIGGGTIGDVAGFAASTYMRGFKLIHIPTTLLSAVDSSVGGKNGLNFRETKNLIGTFYQPDLVLIDTNFFKSLPDLELISGFGEVIKYSYLVDKKFYSYILSNYKLLIKKDVKFLDKIIYESIKIKSAVVANDEKEVTGLRKILNFGHTFAHAFESSSSYKLDHGKAVILGIVSALILSYHKKLIDEIQLHSMLQLPLKFSSSISIRKLNTEVIYNQMAYDKKNRDGKNKFVLIKDFGEIMVDNDVDKKLVIKSLIDTEQNWFKRATAGL